MPVPVPEPFRSALAGGDLRAAADAEATTPEALYGRGLVRAWSGRDREARGDFERAEAAVGDPCRIQVGHLDLRANRRAVEVAAMARVIADRPASSVVEAMAWHLAGLAEAKTRATKAAIDCLLRARELCRSEGRRDLLAQVEDTLGSVHAAAGRLDLATAHFALSLVAKSLTHDTYGTAISLGNLGRVHLRAGRYGDAVACLELDLELARQLGDRRGEGKVVNDLGRCLLEQGDLVAAEARFRESLAIALEAERWELEVYNRKDLALALLGQGRLDDAGTELEAAERLLPTDAAPYVAGVLATVRGQILLARCDERGLEILERAIATFVGHALPDLEIPARITLAEAMAARGLVRSAESILRPALETARRDGYARYLPAIREAMTRLQVVEGVVEESGRTAATSAEESGPDGYVLLEVLGAGGFGQVFRAFDLVHDRVVALKRLHLERLYDVHRRQRLVATARLELEAASLIRHPGVARVYAVGTDPTGGAYVVQELVDGGSLRALVGANPAPDPGPVLATIGQVASALQALHERGVVHRDLKPENILVRRSDGTPVLVDFGIARVPDSDDDVGDDAIVGTLGYMAPEQLRGQPVDGRADVYALGVVAYEWLVGRRPLEAQANNLAVVLRSFLAPERPSLAEARPDLPAEVVDLVDRMLSAEREQRPTAAEVASSCQQLAECDLPTRSSAADVDTASGTEEIVVPGCQKSTMVGDRGEGG